LRHDTQAWQGIYFVEGPGRDSQEDFFVYVFAFLMLTTQLNNPKTSYVLMTR